MGGRSRGGGGVRTCVEEVCALTRIDTDGGEKKWMQARKHRYRPWDLCLSSHAHAELVRVLHPIEMDKNVLNSNTHHQHAAAPRRPPPPPPATTVNSNSNTIPPKRHEQQ